MHPETSNNVNYLLFIGLNREENVRNRTWENFKLERRGPQRAMVTSGKLM